MSQIEVTKLPSFVAIGSDGDEASASKVVMYVLLTPGDPTGEEPTRQVHIYTQKIRRG